MSKMNMLQAINNALDTAMAEDERVLCFGEDVGVLAAYSVPPVTCNRNTAKPAALTRLW